MLGPAGRGELAALLTPLAFADAIASVGAPLAASYFISRGVDERAVRRAGVVVVTAAGAVKVGDSLEVDAINDAFTVKVNDAIVIGPITDTTADLTNLTGVGVIGTSAVAWSINNLEVIAALAPP